MYFIRNNSSILFQQINKYRVLVYRGTLIYNDFRSVDHLTNAETGRLAFFPVPAAKYDIWKYDQLTHNVEWHRFETVLTELSKVSATS